MTFTDLLGLPLLASALYLPPMLLLRLAAEFPLVRALSARKPPFGRYLLLHLGAGAVCALFSPLLCYLMGGLVLREMGIMPSPGESPSGALWAAFWLISYALPLQLHYTVNSVLCRLNSEDGRLSPNWLPWLWTLTTAMALTLAWLPLWMGWVRFDTLAS